MAKELIDQYIDRGKFKSDTDFAVEQLKALYTQFQALGNTKISLSGVQNFSDLAKSVNDAKVQIEGLNSTLSTYTTQQQQSAKAANDASAAAKEYSAVTRENNNTLKQNVQAVRELTERNKQLKIEQQEYTAAYKNGEITLKQYNQRLNASGATISKNSEGIKELNKNIRAQASVISGATGAYAQLSKAYDVAARKAQDLAVVYGSTSPQAKAAAAEANLLADRLKVVDATVGKFQRNVGNYSSTLTGFANTLRGLRGPAKLLGEALGIGAQEADQLRIVLEHAAQGIAAFFKSKEAKAEAAAASAAAETADAAATTASAEASTGAAVANTTYTTTVSTNTAAVGVNTLAAEGLAVAETEVAVATAAASTSLITFSNILKFSGIGLLIGVLGAIAFGFYKIFKTNEDNVRETKAYKESLNDLRDGLAKASEEVAKVKTAFDLAKEGIISQKEALKTYNESIGQTIGQAKNLAEAENLYSAQAENYIKAQGLKAQANALFAKSAEYFSKSLTADLEDNTNAFTKAGAFILNGFSPGLGTDQFLRVQKEKTKEIQDENNKKSKVLDDAAKNLLREAALLSKGFNPVEKGNKDKKATGEKQIQELKESLDTEFQIYKISRERILKTEQDLIKDESVNYTKRLEILDQYVKDADDLNQKDIANQIANIKKQRDADIKRLEEEKAGKNAQQKARINENISIVEKNAQEQINLIIAQGLDKSIEITDAAGKQRVDIIAKHLDEQKKAYEEYDKYQQSVYDDTQTKFEKALAKREQQEKEAAAKLIDIEKELQQKKLDAAIQAEDFLFELGTASLERKKNELQEESDLIDINKQKKIDAINSQQLSEEDKANQIAIIEAIALSKHEEIVRKQKDIDTKKAQFDKLQQIFQIGIETAKTVASIKFAAAKLAAESVGNPLLAALVPLLLAQIPVAIATGAIGIASILAKPIPKYKDGRKGGGEEWAITGDGGISELIQRADGRLEVTPAKDTLTYLGKDDIVHPSINAFLAQSTAGILGVSEKTYDFDKIVEAVAGIQVHTQLITEGGHSYRNQKLSNYNNWAKNIA